MGAIYRIQSKINRERGPYHSHKLGESYSAAVKRLLKEHGDWNDLEHATPEKDKGIDRELHSDEHCGFDYAAKLLQWFKGFIPDLLRAGYEIVALYNDSITVTAVGKRQVLFTWKSTK